ncbi:BlaI/MecI/CopY family transcriptional regulator [Sphingobacterium detergens]|uniref:Putative transcriptional regulator n=1 Tax=Sphingobacterium detergens TaxID=1145106 RepID=A0A420AQS2_SPHD1|nr:BlaI/MecI/CopY family transcriptional regulator [Sphingobacterium detergens]RKE46834.1 putative transcriptional regulator [Sphingobacterium detergens]
MIRLTDNEERVMGILWEYAPITAGEIVNNYRDLKTSSYTTVLKIVMVLKEKGFSSHNSLGRIHLCFPIIERIDYLNYLINDLIAKFFDNSLKDFLIYVHLTFSGSLDLFSSQESLCISKNSSM